MIDALWRGVLFVGYRVMLVWWFVRRPAAKGAYVVVRRTRAGRPELLLARNSYKSGLTVPCGGIARGESARAAAARELEEEVGLRVDPQRLESAGTLVLDYAWRRDHAHFFELQLGSGEQVDIRVDRREVVWAEFVALDQIDPQQLVPHLRSYLARGDQTGAGAPLSPAEGS
jgi:8-oxo-dGTP pyrophosphatase MutT (NUDIX family)